MRYNYLDKKAKIGLFKYTYGGRYLTEHIDSHSECKYMVIHSSSNILNDKDPKKLAKKVNVMIKRLETIKNHLNDIGNK